MWSARVEWWSTSDGQYRLCTHEGSIIGLMIMYEPNEPNRINEKISNRQTVRSVATRLQLSRSFLAETIHGEFNAVFSTYLL